MSVLAEHVLWYLHILESVPESFVLVSALIFCFCRHRDNAVPRCFFMPYAKIYLY